MTMLMYLNTIVRVGQVKNKINSDIYNNIENYM